MIILTRMSLRSIVYGTQQQPQDPNDLVTFAPLLEAAVARRFHPQVH